MTKIYPPSLNKIRHPFQWVYLSFWEQPSYLNTFNSYKVANKRDDGCDLFSGSLEEYEKHRETTDKYISFIEKAREVFSSVNPYIELMDYYSIKNSIGKHNKVCEEQFVCEIVHFGSYGKGLIMGKIWV